MAERKRIATTKEKSVKKSAKSNAVKPNPREFVKKFYSKHGEMMSKLAHE